MAYEGGCLCGSIRYTADGPYDMSCVCYCRMCQKASGAPFMAFVRFPTAHIRWSSPPAVFTSSPGVERAFCRDCGSALTYRRIESAATSLTINTLDDPESVRPAQRFCTDSEPSWCQTLAALPAAGA